jgi:hypothetical protein
MLNSNINLDNTTASSSLSQSDNANAIYSTPYKFNFNEETDLINLENQIKKNIYIKDEILSIDDVLIYEEIRKSKIIIPEKKFPFMYKWIMELERLRKNWRISKRKNKGSTFIEFIKNAEDQLRKEKNKNMENDVISGLQINTNNNNNNSNNNSPNNNSSKHIKKLKEYSMEIGVRFEKNIKKNWSEISSNLNIICQAYLPRDTEIKPIKDDKTGEIFAIIMTKSHKEKYDISYIEKDIKRNIPSVESVNIIEIKEINNNDNNNINNIIINNDNNNNSNKK